MTRSLMVASVILVLGASAWILLGRSGAPKEQVLSGHLHHVTRTTAPHVVDGATDPDLISDAIAYRLFFITVAEPLDAAEGERRRELAYLEAAGLDRLDLQAAIDILATFKGDYDELVNQYNSGVDLANRTGGSPPDQSIFLEQQDRLVESTRESLSSMLSSDGMTRFDAHIQREKKNMKVAEEVQ